MALRVPTLPRAVALLAGTCLLALTALPGHAQESLDTGRKAFKEAYAAVQAGGAPTESQDDGLRSYPLYPYLEAARFQKAMERGDAPDAAVRDFLARHAGEPVAAPLRRAWLANLGQRAEWSTFLAAAPESLSDPALECLQFTARIETDRTADLAPLVTRRWLGAEQLPAECERPFEWLRTTGALTDDLVEQRVRLILARGNARFARMIAANLSAERATPLLQWASLLEQPRREIDALVASPARKVEPAALLAGWTRLAAVDLPYARTRFTALARSRGLDRDAASPYALALALRLAWNRHPDAGSYFNRVRESDFDDTAREWRARAALWSGDWETVAAVIESMPAALAQSSRWKYWSARAAAATGKSGAARELYISLLSTDNYYSAMAAARLGQSITPNPAPVPADEAELARLSSLPTFVRARELLLAGLRNEALAEWQHGLRALPPAIQPQAVHLGMRWRWYDVSISTATQQRLFDDYALLYPRPFDADVKTAVEASGLPESLVYGVLRQESLYRTDAVSPAGAMGLLQMLPETARGTARRAKQSPPASADLFDPAINVRLGALHLKELVDQFDGQVPLALAGYNAGPGAARRWLPEQPVDADVWIENIPFNETRTYVQRILWHTVVFAWLGTGQPQATQHWIDTVSRTNRAASTGDPAVMPPGPVVNTASPR